MVKNGGVFVADKELDLYQKGFDDGYQSGFNECNKIFKKQFDQKMNEILEGEFGGVKGEVLIQYAKEFVNTKRQDVQYPGRRRR